MQSANMEGLWKLIEAKRAATAETSSQTAALENNATTGTRQEASISACEGAGTEEVGVKLESLMRRRSLGCAGFLGRLRRHEGCLGLAGEQVLAEFRQVLSAG